MGWRDFQDSIQVEYVEKVEKVTPPTAHIPHIPLIPPGVDYKNTAYKVKQTDSERATLLSRLTETEREAYQGWYDIMVSERFKMSLEAAHAKAWELLQKSIKGLQQKQAMVDFEMDGFVRIHSTGLGRDIYFAKDERAVSGVRGKGIPIFTLAELEQLEGLRLDEALLLVEAKILFGGVVRRGPGT